MKAVRGCLLWLALYLIVSLALAVIVERRLGERGVAIAAGLLAGAMVTTALSHFFHLGRAVRDLMLIRRTQAGAEPVDGERFAAIGPITPEHADAAIPASIRCGVQSLRIVAEPELKITAHSAKPGAEVCAFGRYSVDRRALVLERNIEKAKGLTARRFSAIGGALMNATVMLAIVAAALTTFFAVVPLDFAEANIADLRPSWLEIWAEDWVETNVRTRLLLAGMPAFVETHPGAKLNIGEARGCMRSGDKEVTVTQARAQWRQGFISIGFYDSSNTNVGGIMIAPPGRLAALTVIEQEIDAETGRHAKLSVHPISKDQISGRVSLVNAGAPMGRVVFRVQVPAGH
ncbi:MAG: hypothetical protein ACXW2P_00350 [Thermoanaerobaculia bacterium]